MAGVEGLEPPTRGFGVRCSANWSYTPAESSLQKRCELRKHIIQENNKQVKGKLRHFTAASDRQRRTRSIRTDFFESFI
jgi:hypothetical protein